MTTSADVDSQGSGTGGLYKFGKEYEVPHPKTRAFMVEEAQWDRIRKRVHSLEAKGGGDWLLALATMVGGIAASALLGLIALPQATQGEQELALFVKPALWALFLGGVAVALAMGLLWHFSRKEKTDTASDICEEMNTIQEAWKERESSSPAEISERAEVRSDRAD
jgi:hypothetical protein